jgi:hypothetical protein
VVVDCLAANAAGVPLRDHEQRRRHVDAEGLGGLEVTTNSSLVGVRFGCPRGLRRTDANKPFCDLAPPPLDASYTQGNSIGRGSQVGFSDLAGHCNAHTGTISNKRC